MERRKKEKIRRKLRNQSKKRKRLKRKNKLISRLLRSMRMRSLDSSSTGWQMLITEK